MMPCKNSTWETMPSYADLLYGMADFVTFFWSISEQVTPAAHLRQLKEDCRFSFNDLFTVIIVAAVLTGFRHYSTHFIFKPLCSSFQLLKCNEKKMPESAWKFTFYLMSSAFALYLTTVKYSFFQKPALVWQNWTLMCDVPTDIYVLHIIQTSFYVHSMYSTLFLDTWRKDSFLLIVHHVVTLMLLFYSVAFRYHNMGVLILLFHDVTDVAMEFSKLNIYFKIQSGKLVNYHEVISNVGFTTFALLWVISRLYWFPLKAIYGLVVTTERLDLRGTLPVLPFVTFLLWIMLAMNVYWFKIIVGLAIRVFTGQMETVDDTREYDVEKKIHKHKKINGHYRNGFAEDSKLWKTTNGHYYQAKRNESKNE